MKQTILAILFFAMPSLTAAHDLAGTDPYKVLGVSPNVDTRGLTKAWKNLIKIHHPDYGGSKADAQNVNEAYQFLQTSRAEYDRGALPFREVYKTVRPEGRALPPPVQTQIENEDLYRALYEEWLDQEPRARDLATRYQGGAVFIFYGMMNLSRAPADFRDFTPWQVEAYVDLINHLNLFTLTKNEFTWITLHHPVEAFAQLIDQYDNFNVRFTTLVDLMRAYRVFFIGEDRISNGFLEVIERMRDNHTLFNLRYKAFHPEIVATLKSWIEFYRAKPRSERSQYRDQYLRTKGLLSELESLPARTNTCARLLLGLRLQ